MSNRAVDGAVDEAVYLTVYDAEGEAVYCHVGGENVCYALYDAVDDEVNNAVYLAVDDDVRAADPHPNLEKFLKEVRDE